MYYELLFLFYIFYYNCKWVKSVLVKISKLNIWGMMHLKYLNLKLESRKQCFLTLMTAHKSLIDLKKSLHIIAELTRAPLPNLWTHFNFQLSAWPWTFFAGACGARQTAALILALAHMVQVCFRFQLPPPSPLLLVVRHGVQLLDAVNACRML